MALPKRKSKIPPHTLTRQEQVIEIASKVLRKARANMTVAQWKKNQAKLKTKNAGSNKASSVPINSNMSYEQRRDYVFGRAQVADSEFAKVLDKLPKWRAAAKKKGR